MTFESHSLRKSKVVRDSKHLPELAEGFQLAMLSRQDFSFWRSLRPETQPSLVIMKPHNT